jgi:hypothetical protein
MEAVIGAPEERARDTEVEPEIVDTPVGGERALERHPQDVERIGLVDPPRGAERRHRRMERPRRGDDPARRSSERPVEPRPERGRAPGEERVQGGGEGERRSTGDRGLFARMRIAEGTLRARLERVHGIGLERDDAGHRELREVRGLRSSGAFLRCWSGAVEAGPRNLPCCERVEDTTRSHPTVDARERARAIDPRAHIARLEVRRRELRR